MMPLDQSRLGGWHDLPFFAQTLPGVEARLARERDRVFPDPESIFRALELCQPDDTKVVILGQDPYHTPGKADGLAFSIRPTFRGRLDSLSNIFKEIQSDLGTRRRLTDLSDWSAQGVLLLNTALTVPEGRAKAHAKLGWNVLVDQVLDRLADRPRAFLLWGKPAQEAARYVDSDVNLKIETAHPSPLSAHRGFIGTRPFSRVNAWLQAQGLQPINWGDPEVR